MQRPHSRASQCGVKSALSRGIGGQAPENKSERKAVVVVMMTSRGVPAK